MKTILSMILTIALFCSNITPVYATDNFMLPENSVNLLSNMDYEEDKDASEIITKESENEESIVEELSVAETINVEQSISDNIMTREEQFGVEEVYNTQGSILPEEMINFEELIDTQESVLTEETDIIQNEVLVTQESISSNVMEEGFVLKTEENLVGRYQNWSEVFDIIQSQADTTKEYIVEISKDTEIKENLKIPSKMYRLIIRGTNTNNPITFSYLGDIKLLSNVSFEFIELKSKKYNSKTDVYEEYLGSIILNGKELCFKNCDLKFSSMKGNGKSVLNLLNSHLEFEKTISNIGYLNMELSNLKTKSIGVTNVLSMKSSILESQGNITLKNVVSDDEKNIIVYQDNSKLNVLNITGNISSTTNEEDENAILKYNIDGENIEQQVVIRKNAISLQMKVLENGGYEKGEFLANVPKAGATWFVIGSEWIDKEDKTVRIIKENTYKLNAKLYIGNANNNVILFSSNKESEESFVMESSFATLQEALNEIDKIGNSTKFYRILLNNSQKDTSSFLDKEIKFPAKAKGLWIQKSSAIQEGNLYFKGNITLKCNVKFEDIIFRNSGKSNIVLGKYELHLKNCYSNNLTECAEFYGVTGSGVKKTSALYLEDTVLQVRGAINNVGKIIFLSAIDEQLNAFNEEEVARIVPAYPEIVAEGRIYIGDVILNTDGKITGITKFTRKNGIITKITPDIIINGKVQSEKLKNLYLDLQEKTKESVGRIDLSTSELEEWKQEKGIPVAKALSCKYPHVYLIQNSQRQLIKKAGYFTYYDSTRDTSDGDYGAELSFVSEGKEEKIYCYGINDAIMEINNQKEKIDYIITLKKAIEESTMKLPQKITFPNKKYVNSLVIQGDKQEEIINLGYLGNLNLTSPLIIKNISFVQMIKKNGVYKSIKEVKNDYPGAVTIKTNGHNLEIKGKVNFDTPIKVDGGKKSVLTFNGSLNTYTNDFEVNAEKGKSVIYGMFTNVHTLALDGIKFSLREAKNQRNGKKFIVSKNKITNLYLYNDSLFEITGVSNKNSLTTQTVSVHNSEIKVSGSGNFKNVMLSGEREAVIFVDKNFNITGTIEVDTNNGYLKTRRKGKEKETYLNISGKVYLNEGRNPIYIGVYYETEAEDYVIDEPINLREATRRKIQILNAKQASIDNFRPMEENYPGGEYSDTNTNGYILEKKGSKIYVCSGEIYK